MATVSNSQTSFMFDLIFLVVCLVSQQSVGAESYADVTSNDNCPNLGQSLGDGCSVNDDCTKITCSQSFENQDITLSLEIDKCDDPVTVTARMQVPDLGIDWSHKYSSDDIVAVPGFTAKVPGLPVSGGVYVQIQLSSDSGSLNMKVKLLAGASVLGKAVYPVKTTIVDSNLPIDTNECGIIRWWRELGTALQVVIIAAPIVVILLIITCCCCCCGCCGNSRPSTAGQTVMIVPGVQPNPAIMTTTNSRVPMQPLQDVA